MPRKVYKKKKPQGKWKRRFGKAVSYADKASKALALATKVARMVNVEYKTIFSGGYITPSSTGTVYQIFVPAQGDAYNQRDGDSIKTLRLSGRAILNINASATNTVLRFILFRGKQENGASYGISDYLQSVSYIAGKSVAEKFRSKCIYDKIYTVDTGNKIKCMDYDFRLDGHMTFTPGTTTVENGGIYMLVISNEATNKPDWNWDFRLTYTDN